MQFIFNILLQPFTKVNSQIDQLKKRFLSKSYEISLVPEFTVWAKKCQKIIAWKK